MKHWIDKGYPSYMVMKCMPSLAYEILAKMGETPADQDHEFLNAILEFNTKAVAGPDPKFSELIEEVRSHIMPVESKQLRQGVLFCQ